LYWHARVITCRTCWDQSPTRMMLMISNESPSPFNRPPLRQQYRQQYHPPQGYQQPPRPYVQEDMLKASEIQIERKSFRLMLKENPRGRFLRIAEENGEKRSSIIVPATGLMEFKRLLDDMVAAAGDVRANNEAPVPQRLEPNPAPAATLIEKPPTQQPEERSEVPVEPMPSPAAKVKRPRKKAATHTESTASPRKRALP